MQFYWTKCCTLSPTSCLSLYSLLLLSQQLTTNCDLTKRPPSSVGQKSNPDLTGPENRYQRGCVLSEGSRGACFSVYPISRDHLHCLDHNTLPPTLKPAMASQVPFNTLMAPAPSSIIPVIPFLSEGIQERFSAFKDSCD